MSTPQFTNLNASHYEQVVVTANVTGAERRTTRAGEYQPDSIVVKYTRYGPYTPASPSVQMRGGKVKKDGTVGKQQAREWLLLWGSDTWPAWVQEFVAANDPWGSE